MRDYRDDDQTVGYCPKCGSRLTTLNVDAVGYCGLHGWVAAEWEQHDDAYWDDVRKIQRTFAP